MRISLRGIVLITASVVLATGRAAGQREPKPVAGMPFQYWDVLEVDGAARKVYFRNDSPAPITITQVVVQKCENTRQLCGTYPANLVVAPGKTVVAFKAEQFDRKLGWGFAYTFRTHGSPTSVMSGPPSGSIVRSSDGSTAVLQVVPIDSLAPAVAAWTDGASCGKLMVPDLPPGHQALMMIFGTASQPTARRVMVRLDGNGSAYDFNDLRRDPNDSSSDPRQTSITLDLVRQTAMVRNSGGGQPSTYFRASGPTLLTSAALAMPGETIAKIVKECGSK